AWKTPAIEEWQDWAKSLVAQQSDPDNSAVFISAYHSKMLWERCLRREINDPLLNYGALARVARDTYQKVNEWRVPLADCRRSAKSLDQRVFADVAASYQSILEREGWSDRTRIICHAIELIEEQQNAMVDVITLAGFDRISPQLQTLLDALTRTGTKIEFARKTPERRQPQRRLAVAENNDAELRAAGAWARSQVEAHPGARIAIVVSELEKDAHRSARLIQEGLLPGWQYSNLNRRAAINVSYGQRLSDIPAIADALLALQWLYRELPTLDVCRLLRATTIDEEHAASRVRHDLLLRQFPEQGWSAAQVLQYLSPGGDEESEDLQALRVIDSATEELPKRQSPGAWVALLSKLLEELDWPGSTPLDSEEFQTVNRWRELLNEVARLELITPSMTIAEIIAHLGSMAAETLFQPEGQDAAVNVLGPLEAAGLEFDAIWVTGMASATWPPQGHSLPLVSRELQREFKMPDATPADTLAYANRVVSRLADSAMSQVFSYPQSKGDAQLFASGLLEELQLGDAIAAEDPDWHAKVLHGVSNPIRVATDPVPALVEDETVSGGANTIQLQFVEPFSAFVTGRLGVRRLYPVEPGLPANVRGSLIHGALHKLYEDCPTQSQIRTWLDGDLKQRQDGAVATAFFRFERHADATLSAVLQLEKQRISDLLEGVIAVDIERESFDIAGVEQVLQGTIAGLPLRLRVDRVDHDARGKAFIIDYKSGTPKRLLGVDGRPKDMQLVVYAYVAAQPISGIALLNIDTRSIQLDAAGEAFPGKLEWD
ncbi:MAG: PD-(D/E)XK nuclease family protein, partial [Pseudomonadota bacterium]